MVKIRNAKHCEKVFASFFKKKEIFLVFKYYLLK